MHDCTESKILNHQNITTMTKFSLLPSSLLIGFLILSSCNNADSSKATADKEVKTTQSDTPEYFNLRPQLEKDYGYSHAVKIGDDIKISGAVSMNRDYSCTR